MRKKLKRLILYHKRLHPSLTEQDICKIIYQGTMGPLHIMKDNKTAISSLKNELNKARYDRGKENERFIETVDIDGELIRVNLRVYCKYFSNAETLFDVLTTTCKKFIPDRKRFLQLMEIYKTLILNGEIHFNYKKVQMFDKLMRDSSNLLSHSYVYKRCERPLYRVVLRSVFIEEFKRRIQTGGEGGIRTRDRDFSRYTISNRAPSASSDTSPTES